MQRIDQYGRLTTRTIERHTAWCGADQFQAQRSRKLTGKLTSFLIRRLSNLEDGTPIGLRVKRDADTIEITCSELIIFYDILVLAREIIGELKESPRERIDLVIGLEEDFGKSQTKPDSQHVMATVNGFLSDKEVQGISASFHIVDDIPTVALRGEVPDLERLTSAIRAIKQVFDSEGMHVKLLIELKSLSS